jgi:hypothetical protein
MNEEWRAIPGFSDYEVSNLGRVRSWRIKGNTTKPVIEPRILRKYPSGFQQKYRSVKLYKENKGHTISVHRLVLETFIGPKPEGQETRHLNGISTDNRLDNLAYGTHTENMADQVLHGTAVSPSGEAHGMVKITEEQVLAIRQRYENKEATQRQLAKEFGLHQTTISLIVRRKKWKHI